MLDWMYLTRAHWRLKGFGGCLNNLLLFCYLGVTFSRFGPAHSMLR
jgi:hypothetical protein